MKNIVGSTNSWCKISNLFGFLKQATKMWKKLGMGQIKLEWFFLKANKSKSQKIHFKVKQTTKLW